MRLIDHVGRSEAGRLSHLGVDELVENEEQAEGIDGAGIEIVVAIFRIVEVKARKLLDADQPRDDLFDVRVRWMMPEIDQAFRLGAEFLAAIRLEPQSEITVE